MKEEENLEIHLHITDNFNHSININIWTNMYGTISFDFRYNFDFIRLHNASIKDIEESMMMLLNRDKYYGKKQR